MRAQDGVHDGDRRAWWGLTVLLVPSLLVAMDMTALLIALPFLGADLGAGPAEQLWISDGYGFSVAALVITMGTLGDRVGRRRLLLVGGAVFGLLSIVAAGAPSPIALIVVRVLLGVAGATLMPSTLALISSMFPDPRRRGTAIALWATTQFTGGALGPVLAGLLLQGLGWRSVFLLAVPAMAVLLIAGPFLLPEHRNPAPARLDPVSVVLSLVAVLLVVYGLKQLAVGAAGALVPAAAIVVGVGVGAGFVRRQMRLPAPLLDLRLLANRPVTSVLGALVLAGVAMAGTGLLVAQYLQGTLGFGPAVAAVAMAPMGLGSAVGTMLAPTIARRVPIGSAIAGGLAVSALGCLVLAGVGPGNGLPFVLVGITVLALGTGPLFALGTGLVIGSVPTERAGSAASMSETSNYLGGSLGMAVLGAAGMAVYHGRMVAAGAPAVDTPAAAAALGAALPAERSTALLRDSGAALSAALDVVGLVGACLFAVLVVVVGLGVRSATAGRSAPVPA